jgi:hypothetical protein
MRRIFFVLPVILLLNISCRPIGVDVQIRNRSHGPIDSIRVYTSTKASEILFVRVEGGERSRSF